MRDRVAAAVLLLGASTLGGCLIIPEPDHGTVVVGDADGHLSFDGRDNTPTGPMVVAHRAQTPDGEFVVETYDSDLGACFDVVNPQAVREPVCEDTTPIIEDLGPINLAGQWREDGDTGPVHYGLVREDVEMIRLEPHDDTEPVAFRVLDAPNVHLRFVFAIGPEGWTEYDIAAYSADGCLLHREPYAVPSLRKAHGPVRPLPECSEKLPGS